MDEIPETRQSEIEISSHDLKNKGQEHQQQNVASDNQLIEE